MDETTRQGENQQNPMTEYVVTRWYRCPELLLSPNRPYDEAIDLWSIGCILAELLRRKPLFPGKSHANQVQLIFEVMGFSSVKDLGFPVSAEAASFLEKRCRGRKQPLPKLFPDASVQAVELLESLLMLNPSDRPNAEESLQYAFFGDAEVLHDYSKEYLKPPAPDFFDFEKEKFTVPVLKAMIDNEVLLSSATNYRKPTVPSISVPSFSGKDHQPLSHPHSMHETHTSRTDASSMSSAMNPATSTHSSTSYGAGPPSQQMTVSHQQQQQYARRNQPQGNVGKNNGANGNSAKPVPAYRRLSNDGFHHGSSEDIADGPVSQLSTQVRNIGVRGVASEDGQGGNNNGRPTHPPVVANANNPFRKQQSQQPAQSETAEAQEPAENKPISQPPPLIYAPASARTTASTAPAPPAGEPLSVVDGDDHSVLGNLSNGGNILTNARNEPMPNNVAALLKVSSTKKAPKTPSPKKMEQILQMDLNNKRRFLMQGLQKQQQVQGQGQATTANNPSTAAASTNFNSSGSGSSVNSLSSVGARVPSATLVHSYNNGNMPSSRVGSKKEDATTSISSTSATAIPTAGSAASNANANPYNTRSSAAIIMNGGSNVIHNEYDIYANKKKQYSMFDHGR